MYFLLESYQCTEKKGNTDYLKRLTLYQLIVSIERSRSSSYIEEVKNDELLLRSPRPENRWIIDDNATSQKFFNLQVKAAKCINGNAKDDLVLEECLF